tara:strand:- start:176808 stop:178616 length:1809 start_codon:yes stop_codon:yes gene_type:complete
MQTAKKVKKEQSTYKKFDSIDGSHPFKDSVPKGFVDYPARLRKGGKLAYFNFDLAREMGLMPKSHPDKLNKELESKILETFGIVIINEYDKMNSKSFPQKEIKEGTYMATRYLQMQHEDKTGRTSGDGRSVWMGHVKHRGKSWDISSCGTGATCLSPATSKYNKFFETGDPSISYGCGYAELDEGMATALFSDIFHENHVPTEQTLAVIQYEKNFSINVRVHECLLRPSHFFGYLKQGDYKSLNQITEYYIHSKYPELAKKKKKNIYELILQDICHDFAKVAALFEDEYIFCWLDWDGDNILMDGSIIDYGSIRQFGLYHSEYRYDDVERFSTSLAEQKDKAKYIVQTFCQLFDYLEKKEKTPINEFKNHKVLKDFDQHFEDYKDQNLLHKIGLNSEAKEMIFTKHRKLITEFRKDFSYFEKTKSKKGIIKVNDGITWDAIFCMRDMLRELPQIYLSRNENISDQEFIEILRSNYAKEEDLYLNSYRHEKIKSFQNHYWKIIKKVSKETNKNTSQVLLEVTMRSSVINKAERVTGDAITLITDMLLKKKEKLGVDGIYRAIKKITQFQAFDPKMKTLPKKKFFQTDLMKNVFEIVKDYREGL